MADKTNERNRHEIFWSKIDMESSEEEDAYVPGISQPGNRRPSRIHGRKTREVRAKIPLSQPLVEDHAEMDPVKQQAESRTKQRSYPSSKVRAIEKPRQMVSTGNVTGNASSTGGRDLPPTQGRDSRSRLDLAPSAQGRDLAPEHGQDSRSGRGQVSSSTRQQVEEILSCTLGDVSDSMSCTMESFAERSIRRLQKASLKDLRPEDKQRVANLIKELARVGEEKEKAVQDLHGEREHYEKQVVTLVEQQEKILKEREDVQEKLFQCQQLLTDYQAQILNRAERTTPAKKHKTSKSPAVANPVVVVELGAPDSGSPNSRRRGPVTTVTVNEGQSAEVMQVKDYYQSERQPRSHDRPSTKRSSNHNQNNPILANQGGDCDSVSDLLIQAHDPTDRIKRPFTSMIDKEIARERSRERSMERSLGHISQGSRSRSASPSNGRPRYTYPQKPPVTGPLQEPIASSTHKSMDINAQLSNINMFDPDSPRSSLRGSSVRGQSPAASDRHSKVAFIETAEREHDAKVHSPNLQGSKMFKNPEYVDYYRKLSPSGRKQELLRQRQALLDEQERLRLVLEKQERQLRERHAEYDKRQELQKERMEFYKTGGKFPALRLDFDGDSERGDRLGYVDRDGGDRPGYVDREHMDKWRDRVEPERVTVEVVTEDDRREEMGRVTPDRDVDIDDVHVRSRMSAGTSPINHHGNRVSVATSPVQSHSSGGSGTPRMVDVATSVSYRPPLSDASNRQGNLPLYANRQRHSPAVKQGYNQAVKQGHSPGMRQEMPPSCNTPGEKTLNVVELVNSLDDGPVHLDNSYGESDRENRPRYLPAAGSRHSAGSHLTSHTHHKERSSPMRKTTSSSKSGTSLNSHNKRSDDKEESQEESQILEDIFFL